MAVYFDHKNHVIKISQPVTFAELMMNCMMFCEGYGDYVIEATLVTTWKEQIDITQELKWLKGYCGPQEINPDAN